MKQLKIYIAEKERKKGESKKRPEIRLTTHTSTNFHQVNGTIPRIVITVS